VAVESQVKALLPSQNCWEGDGLSSLPSAPRRYEAKDVGCRRCLSCLLLCILREVTAHCIARISSWTRKGKKSSDAALTTNLLFRGVVRSKHCVAAEDMGGNEVNDRSTRGMRVRHEMPGLPVIE